MIARCGRIEAQVNLLSFLDPIASRYFELPCKEIYSVCIEDSQAFVEKRRNVFNFHLLDPSLDIPNAQDVMKSLSSSSSITSGSTIQPSTSFRNTIGVENDVSNLTPCVVVDENGNGVETFPSSELSMNKMLKEDENNKSTAILDTNQNINTDNDPSAEMKANEIVTSMLGAVSSIGRAVMSEEGGGREGLEKTLNEHKKGFLNKLKEFQQQTSKKNILDYADALTSHLNTEIQNSQNMENNKSSASMSTTSSVIASNNMGTFAMQSVKVMKEMGKAVEKNVSEIQAQIESYKKPPQKKKDWKSKPSNDLFRIGYIIVKDLRVFTKELVLVNNIGNGTNNSSDNPSAANSSAPPPSALNTSNTATPDTSAAMGKSNSTIDCSASGWSQPILFKTVTMSSADLSPPKYRKKRESTIGGGGATATKKSQIIVPPIALRIDEYVNIIIEIMLAEMAKTKTGDVFKIAMGDVFAWLDQAR